MHLKKYFSVVLFSVLLCACNNSGISKSNKAYNSYVNNPLIDIRPSVLPVLGNKNAKTQIAIFFDPWCPPCRAFESELEMILSDKKYANSFGASFYIFDLGHFPNDDEASLLHLEMARRNLYTEFRKQVVEQNVAQYPKMLEIAEGLAKTKLPLSVINRNKALLDEETRLVKEKGLEHTPTIFINGKRLEDTPQPGELEELINYINKN